jgi:diacylglycerol kinase (ATP)
MPRHFVIFNPASGRGRGKRRIEVYKRLLVAQLSDVTFAESAGPGGERELAEQATHDEYDVVVAVGGDGTWSTVADRLIASGRDDVALGVLPNGTGNDFGRSLGLDPSDAETAVRILAAGHTEVVDVGLVETESASEHIPDRWEKRYFLNLIGFGFDIAVIDAAAEARFLKGELLYKITALRQLFRFPGLQIRLSSEDGRERDGQHLMLTVSNAPFFGGGFPIAPDASVHDGKLHACQILDAPPLSRLRLFNLAERGRHVTSDRVEVLDDTGFRLDFPTPPRFEVDGDVRRAAGHTVEARVLPAALKVIARKST